MVFLGIFRTLMKKRELIPLVTIVSFAGFMGVYSLGHAINKNDYTINKTGNPEPWNNVDPTKSAKLITLNQQWKPIEELEKVRKAMK